MAQNVTIAGASYTDVPAIDIPKTGGGTAKFVDTTDANATAPDIQSGKTAYINGQKVTGTGSGATLQSKSVTYASNGSAIVTPDAGYDGLSSVDVTVNVPSTPTQTKSMTLGRKAPSTVTPDSGYALSSVSPSIDTSVIKAENIAQGATILGITGTYQGMDMTLALSMRPRYTMTGTYRLNEEVTSFSIEGGGAIIIPAGTYQIDIFDIS